MTLRRDQQVPVALAAFVRGNERRAWTFLWLQGGCAAAADSALSAAIRAFATQVGRQPMAQWPTRFWRLVAAAPLAPPDGQWPEELKTLAGLAPVPRRALLLRLAVGLDEAPAADALGVDLATYRKRLEQACPRDRAGAVDADAWQRLAQAVQQAGRTLPPWRLSHIADLGEAGLSGDGQATDAGVPATPARPDRRWRWMLLVALACAAALAATWWWERRPADAPPAAHQADDGAPDIGDPGPILVEPLPDIPDAAPAARPVVPAEPVPLDPVVEALDLLSWYIAGAPDSRIEHAAASTPPDAAPPVDVDIDADARRSAWRHLDAAEQARLRAAAVTLDALPEDERDTLRARFAALDAVERRGWLLGPVLGADYAGLHPLLGYVAADEREPLLATLRAMRPDQRAHLAEVARRASPAARARLRRELLAQPPAQWDAWLARHSDG